MKEKNKLKYLKHFIKFIQAFKIFKTFYFNIKFNLETLNTRKIRDKISGKNAVNMR
jgi:hypothetical protein